MNQKIQEMRYFIKENKHHQYRRKLSQKEWDNYASIISDPALTLSKRAVRRLKLYLDAQQPVLLPGECISGLRTVSDFPGLYSEDEWKQIQAEHYIHEQGRVCNVTPDYASVIQNGLNAKRSAARMKLSECLNHADMESVAFLEDAIASVDAVERFAEKYACEATVCGNREQARVLKKVPMNGAKTFHEALQSFRIIHFVLWCAGNYHNTVGRFDQYMYPYYRKDIKRGRITKDQAFDLLQEFFLSFNRDSDLYTGMQQGDNGQSMVLGGLNEDGTDSLNELSMMCLDASLGLGLIDPKINLRVHRGTDINIYVAGTQLTRRGLGFPQYSNDDVVIPGLIEKGYEKKDAYNYTTAACWEWIIPGSGMDIPNIGAVSLAKIAKECVVNYLTSCEDFDSLMQVFKSLVQDCVQRTATDHVNLFLEPAPYLSVLMDSCIEKARDVSCGLKYNNYGLHGTGIATAVDSLMAVKKSVYENRTVDANELIEALQMDYEGYEQLCIRLRNNTPKFGRDSEASAIAKDILDMFADAVGQLKNERGGVYRAGTGSAMYYLWHADKLGATPDGRKANEPLSTNFSPSLYVKDVGPVSVIRNLAIPNLHRVANGGPLTLELHDTVFRNEESVLKVAALVKSYIDLGGHQLQLNAVNRETMCEAQIHPENHQNLIVRVWGWSGYFIELDKKYQDQIIARTEFTI